jgi:hypothetical protein
LLYDFPTDSSFLIKIMTKNLAMLTLIF